MDVPVKALARLGINNLDLPSRLECNSTISKSNVIDDVGPTAGTTVKSVKSAASSAASTSGGGDGVDARSEDGSQDSLAVEVDGEVPSSMSSMDDDDEYDEDYLNRRTDDRFVSCSAL